MKGKKFQVRRFNFTQFLGETVPKSGVEFSGRPRTGQQGFWSGNGKLSAGKKEIIELQDHCCCELIFITSLGKTVGVTEIIFTIMLCAKIPPQPVGLPAPLEM